ncbi:Uncharacterised protein [Salmonella enterica subsp. enterica]|uniref:Uncharacterized protein n=1 Tax=Salmonella enterica I TaxID=59201 RepID=A0A3S4LX34_SALET|nr:Uncharacterised protein [Salmonella enterica subsp. enterica]
MLKKETRYAFSGNEFWLRLAAILPVGMVAVNPRAENYPIVGADFLVFYRRFT